MKIHELTVWIEAHPGESILIGGGGLLVILWLLGYFSPSASAPAQDPLAAAYYAAEAQQAVVGGQIQQATIGAARDTAVAGLQANAAVAINAAQTGAATTINGQNTGAATTINQSSNDAASAQILGVSSDQLQATYSNNAANIATTQANNATAQAINASNNNASVWQTAMNTILPVEQANNMGGAMIDLGDFGHLNIGSHYDYASLLAQGFSTLQAADIYRAQHGGVPAA